jgi:hypothetical protein
MSEGDQQAPEGQADSGSNGEAAGVASIRPAPTGVAAILGHSRIGPTDRPVWCQRLSDFSRSFGDMHDAPTLAAAVHGFFQNGGKRCLVLNLGPEERPLRPADLEHLPEGGVIELVCAPGKVGEGDWGLLIRHCESVRTRLALLDGPADLARHIVRLRPPQSFAAALYVPWLRVYDPSRNAERAVPPSGHVAGLMARVASERGVHKAPANEPLEDITGLADEISQAEQDILHPRRVNCIRRLPRLSGLRPWGAQTLAAQPPFRTISAFRVHSLVARSFQTGLSKHFAELSGRDLWQQIQAAGTAFLTDLWESGALVGERAEDAFRVRCDADLNEPAGQDPGVVVVEIGLALERPRAFFTFRVAIDLTPW